MNRQRWRSEYDMNQAMHESQDLAAFTQALAETASEICGDVSGVEYSRTLGGGRLEFMAEVAQGERVRVIVVSS